VVLPDGVSARLEGSDLVLKGPKGELRKNFRDVYVRISIEGNLIKIYAENATRRQKMTIGTFLSHVKNMSKGVSKGYVYKLRICSGHFPMNVSFANGEISIKNFIGEKVPRVVKVRDGIKVNVQGTDITIEAADKELAGQTAADIEQITRRPGFDTRIFQSGIYIIDKAGKDMKTQ